MTRPLPTAERSTSPSPPAAKAVDDRLALAVFVAYLIVAFFVIILVLGDERWFLFDEWTFLADRQTADLGDYFEPVNGHWVALPLVVWRFLFEVFGLHTYLPYQVPVVVMHLTAAFLLRVVMIRAGVGPWIATITAGSFVLLGAGEDNIVWGFQITLVGSLVFGLAQLILSDHDGDLDRRDGLALGSGMAALLCSGVAIPMVMAVGLSVLMRRGWRMAAFQTVPLGVAYGIWHLVYQPQNALLPDGVPLSTVTDLGAQFVWNGVSGIFVALGHYPIVGLALGVMFVVGLAMAWLPLAWSEFRRRANLPVGLLLALVIALVSTMLARLFLQGVASARSPRYMHLFVALALPAVAVAADALWRRWRPIGAVAIALLVVGIPANTTAFEESLYGKPYFDGTKHLVFGIGRTDEAARVPDWVRPEPSRLLGATVGWLRQIDESGDLPEGFDPDPAVESTWPLQLGLAFRQEPIPAALECTSHTTRVDLKPEVGSELAIETKATIVQMRNGKADSAPYAVDPFWNGPVMSVELEDLELRFRPSFGEESFTLCR